MLTPPTEIEIAEAIAATTGVGTISDVIRRLAFQRDMLRQAIILHRAHKADDRCIEDDDRLYEALGDGIKCDRRVGDKDAMLANCKRFIEQRCEGGGPWKSYEALRGELFKVAAALHRLDAIYRDEMDEPRERPSWLAEALAIRIE